MNNNESRINYLSQPFLDEYGNVPVDVTKPTASSDRLSESERIAYLSKNSKINFRGIPLAREVIYKTPAAESLAALELVNTHKEEPHRVSKNDSLPESINFRSVNE